jgi:hypothetical protein
LTENNHEMTGNYLLLLKKAFQAISEAVATDEQ